LLAAFRRRSPAEQRAFVDALRRCVEDGEPFEDCMIECAIECGASPVQAREMVRRAIEQPSRRWRESLR
jgi:hypothetical protein